MAETVTTVLPSGNPGALVTLELLRKMWPHGDQHVAGLLEGIAEAAPVVFAKYGADTAMAVAHAMGQFSEESGAGLEMIENMNYSEQGLRKTFPTHFSGSMAHRLAHNPRMIADVAYGGRMGNARPPSDDGWNFRGRGLSQVTGHEGYHKLQDFLHEHGVEIDIMEDPDLIIDPRYTLECGVADWILCGCLPFAKANDTLHETKHLNGGTNGLSVRRVWITRWMRALGV